MPYASMSIEGFAAAVGEKSPAPASGSATAVAAALAASLVELTARFSDDEQALAEAAGLRRRLLALADEDAAAYSEFMRTRSDEARSRTIDVPLDLAEAAAAVARLGERLEREGNPNLVGDAAAAILLARAAVRSAARLVEINLGGRDDPRGARARRLDSEAADGR
ncbi:MAG: cyclodeaminase/cyclohydrolase family protein [Gaiellaceae bacterium]